MSGLDTHGLAAENRSARTPGSFAPLREVAGRVAVVTGGSSGIGLGIARACSAAGMKVIITYRTSAHLKHAKSCFGDDHVGFHAIRLDVTDRKAMLRAADAVQNTVGDVHLLCCNAGVGISTTIAAATFGDWDFGMSVNVGGVINTLQAFLPRILAHGGPAHVVATASMSGLLHGGQAGVYTTTKFAVVGMMEALRAELAERAIGVSVFCPGLVATNIFASHRNRPAKFSTADAASKARTDKEKAFYRSLVTAGMDPLDCGQLVLDGVRRNDMYILTHPEFELGLTERFDAVLSSIRRSGHREPPATRLEAEKTVLRHSVYFYEKTRLSGGDCSR